MAYISLKNVNLIIEVASPSQRSWRKNLVQGVVGGGINKTKKSMQVQALRDISLDANISDRIGVLGHNGSGKSTLLRLIAGIYKPSSGLFKINGRVSTIFSLGQGMNQELSGIENILRLAIYNGMSVRLAKNIVEDVLDFAELGDFANLPVKIYSSGMLARLSFGVATAIKPEVLLIDEIIGVGDINFQKKAHNRISNLIDSVQLLLLASHSKEIVDLYCNRTICLEAGKVVNDGAD